MYGTLVPGPDHTDLYPVDKTLQESFELGYQEPIIYTGGHLSVLARMIDELGSAAGEPLPVFPDWIMPDADERRSRYFVRAYARSDVSPANGLRIVADIHSHSFIEPQERNELGFRIYLGVDAGGADALAITSSWGGEHIEWSGPHPAGTGMVYFDCRFRDQYIGPGEYRNYRRRVEFIVRATDGRWSDANDHSLAGLPTKASLTDPTDIIDSFPVYDYSSEEPVLLGGLEPSAGYVRWRRALFNNTWEQAGSVRLIAERIGGDQGDVTATVSLSELSALVDVDYQMPTTATLQWDHGERGPEVIDIPIIQDDLSEDLEVFEAALVDLTGGLLAGDRTHARVAIEDDDPTGVPSRTVTISTTVDHIAWDCSVPSVQSQGAGKAYRFSGLRSDDDAIFQPINQPDGLQGDG